MQRRLARRLAFSFTCALPFLAAGLAALRPLRGTGLEHVLGLLVLALALGAIAASCASALRDGQRHARQFALGGALLQVPFLLMGLLWIGLGTPWDATPSENVLRYLVLLAMAVSVLAGFAIMRSALLESGERVHSTLAFAAMTLAAPIHVVWSACLFGTYEGVVRTGHVPTVFTELNATLDLLLFVAGALTYVATAELALAMASASQLGRGCARVYVVLNVVALALLVARGVHFLSPAELSAPWYATPGFVVGIPAIPYVMPALLGAVAQRRASEASERAR